MDRRRLAGRVVILWPHGNAREVLPWLAVGRDGLPGVLRKALVVGGGPLTAPACAAGAEGTVGGAAPAVAVHDPASLDGAPQTTAVDLLVLSALAKPSIHLWSDKDTIDRQAVRCLLEPAQRSQVMNAQLIL